MKDFPDDVNKELECGDYSRCTKRIDELSERLDRTIIVCCVAFTFLCVILRFIVQLA